MIRTHSNTLRIQKRQQILEKKIIFINNFRKKTTYFHIVFKSLIFQHKMQFFQMKRFIQQNFPLQIRIAT